MLDRAKSAWRGLAERVLLRWGAWSQKLIYPFIKGEKIHALCVPIFLPLAKQR
jgi:hypothetical protein